MSADAGRTPYTRRVPTASDLVGELLDGRYRVVEHLADGGMATVYRGVDTRLERDVALKVMHPHLVHDEAFVTRFRREARSAARLSHPNVVAVYDQGEDAGRFFLAMEYVPGQTLRQVLDAEGALTPRAALDILRPMLEALGAAHTVGIIHRDIKPENVILREDGVVKVADFGLARAVTSQTVTGASGVLLGTVAYLSPEQVARGVADARSDVYAAGLVLFEMLTGTKAFDGDTPINVAYQHVHGAAPTPSTRNPGVPAALDDLVATASARDPDDRPADAGALLALVRTIRAGLSPVDLDSRPRVGHGAAAEPEATRPVDPTTALERVSPQTARLPVPVRPDAERGRPRRARWPWVLVVLSGLLAAATAWFFFLGPGVVETVPQVAGLPHDAAASALTAQNLRVGAEREEFSETVARGVVIASSPEAGASARRGAGVDLVLSRGPERYAVPQLAGRTLAEARQRLTDGHLALGDVREEYDEKVPEGQVVSIEPTAGTKVKPGTSVAVVTSLGPRPIDVPDVTGQPLARARAAVTGAGLTVTVSERNDDTVPKGSVIAQTPAGGTLHRGEAVALVVSKGPVLVAVPDVAGRQVDEARRILTEAGFTVQVEELFGGIFGTVRFQSPEAGAKAPKGSTVVIRVV